MQKHININRLLNKNFCGGVLKNISVLLNRLPPGGQMDPVRASADVRRAAHFHVAQRRMWL